MGETFGSPAYFHAFFSADLILDYFDLVWAEEKESFRIPHPTFLHPSNPLSSSPTFTTITTSNICLLLSPHHSLSP